MNAASNESNASNASNASSDEGEYEPSWYAYEGGATIDEVGPERGLIVRDEEYGDPEDDEDADARLTLEQGRADNPGWFVTATLYGWLFHTHRAASESAANTAYDAIKGELAQLAAMIPYEEDRDVPIKVKALTAAIAEFENKYP